MSVSFPRYCHIHIICRIKWQKCFFFFFFFFVCLFVLLNLKNISKEKMVIWPCFDFVNFPSFRCLDGAIPCHYENTPIQIY